MESEIRIVNSADKDEHFAYTDSEGAVKPDKDCERDARFTARPKINIYRRLSRLPYCAPSIEIVLQRSGVAEQLASKAQAAEKVRAFGLASLLYAESAYRLDDVNPVLANSLRGKALTSLQQEYPKVELLKFDSHQDKLVLSKQGVKFLKAVQVERGLRPTGKLDLATLQAISGQQIFPHIKDAYESAAMASPQSPYRWESDDANRESIRGPLSPREQIRRETQIPLK